MEGSKVFQIFCLLGLAAQVFSSVVPSPQSCTYIGNDDLVSALNAAIQQFSPSIRYGSGIYYNDGNTPYLASDCSAGAQYPENPTGTLSRVIHRKKIRFGFSNSFDVNFIQRVGQDLAYLVGQQYQVELEVAFVPTSSQYPHFLNDLNNDKFDALFDSWSRWGYWGKDEREDVASWTCSLDFTYSSAIAVGKVTHGFKHSMITSFEDLGLDGLAIGTLSPAVVGDISLREVEMRFPHADVSVYHSVNSLIKAAQDGEVNVIVSSERTLRNACLNTTDVFLVGVSGFLEGISVAVRKDYVDCFTECPTNNAPVIQNVQVYTPEVNQLKVVYDLVDEDKYNMVAVYASYVSDFVEIPDERLSGDIGAGVTPNAYKSFLWDGALSGQYKIRIVANDGVRYSNVYEQEFLVEWPSADIDDYKVDCTDNTPYFLHSKATKFHDRRGYSADPKHNNHVNYIRPLPIKCAN